MKGLVPLFIGLFGTFTFSWVGLTVIPNLQIGALNPQMDEEGTDIYPMPQSGMVDRGRRIYAANGCIYCHSQQVRPDYAGADIDRKWGQRRSGPRDYVFDRPVQLGKERMGPDLANIGKRGGAEEEKSPAPGGSPAQSPAPGGQPGAANPSPAGSIPQPGASPAQSPNAKASPAGSAPQPAASPAQSETTAAASPSPAASASPNPSGEPAMYSEAWHHKHLYAPRSMNPDTRDSNMPAYQFLYETRRINGDRSADALQLTGADAPPDGWEVVPTYDAECLVAYLMSRDQSHPLKEVKGGAAPAGSPAASPAPGAAAASPAAQPPKK